MFIRYLSALLNKPIDSEDFKKTEAFFRAKSKLEEERIVDLLEKKQAAKATEVKAGSVSDSVAVSAEAKIKPKIRKVTTEQDAQDLLSNDVWKNLIVHTLLVNLNNTKFNFSLEEVFAFQEPLIAECGKFASATADVPDNLLSIIILLLQKMELKLDESNLAGIVTFYTNAAKATGKENLLGVGKVVWVLNAVATALSHIQDGRASLFVKENLTSSDEKERNRALADQALAEEASPIAEKLLAEDKQFEEKQREEKSRIAEQHQQSKLEETVFAAPKTEQEKIADKNNRLLDLYVEFDKVMVSKSVDVLLKTYKECNRYLQTLESFLQTEAKEMYERYFDGKLGRNSEELYQKILSDLNPSDADKAAEVSISEQAKKILMLYCEVLHLCRHMLDSRKTAEQRVEFVKLLLGEERGALVLQKDFCASSADSLSQATQEFVTALHQTLETPISEKLTKQALLSVIGRKEDPLQKDRMNLSAATLVKRFSFLLAGDSSVQPQSVAQPREYRHILQRFKVFRRVEPTSPAEVDSPAPFVSERHLKLLD